jgi:hypothetical protein
MAMDQLCIERIQPEDGISAGVTYAEGLGSNSNRETDFNR